MAAATKSTKYTVIGTGINEESNVLVESVNFDVDTNIDFSLLNVEELEVSITSASAKTGTPSVVFNLQRFNPATQLFETILSSTALTDAGNRRLLVGAQVVPTANVAAQAILTDKMRLNMDYTGTPVTDVLNGVTVAVFAS